MSEGATAAAPVQSCDWLDLVGWSGDAGRTFREVYARPEHVAIVAGTDRALALLRKRQVAPAVLLLQEAGERLSALTGAPMSVTHVLERWYYGVSAYHLYCVAEHRQAAEALDRADLAVRSAIEEAPFLLPLAHHCHEFQLHHARIARDRRNFREMQERVARTRAMVEGRAPLCALSDGTSVDYDALFRHCTAIVPPGAGPAAEIAIFGDAALRRRLLDRFLLELHLLPGFILSTPPLPQR